MGRPDGGTILLVEDKEPVRTVLREALEDLGYVVLAAKDGTEALAHAEDHDGEIHLLLADIVMPGMRGDEVAHRFSEMRPGAHVLFMSGYTKKAVADNLIASSGAGFISKPFSLKELHAKVREILSRGESPRV